MKSFKSGWIRQLDLVQLLSRVPSVYVDPFILQIAQ